MNEYFKNLDNSLFDKYNVNIYRNNYDINDFIINNDSDEPFYLIDLGDIFKLFNNWINLMPNIKPFYAVKCNPNLAIIETLSFLGVSFDCASEKEINTVLEITKDPSRIIFANPCKMISHLKYAKEKNQNLFFLVLVKFMVIHSINLFQHLKIIMETYHLFLIDLVMTKAKEWVRLIRTFLKNILTLM
jgi:hypothetical protein